MNRVQPDTQLPKYPAIATYIALISQSGTDDPIATELHNNTGGTVTWSRETTGVYTATVTNIIWTSETASISISQTTTDTIAISYILNTTQAAIETNIGTTGAKSDNRIDKSVVQINIYNTEYLGTNNTLVPYPQPYRIYSALLTQTGTNNPVATILQNTIGTITWIRNATGAYEGNYTPGFPLAKTTLTINTAYNNMMFYLANFETGEPSTQILLKTYETAGDPLSINDGLLYYAFIEIRIYN